MPADWQKSFDEDTSDADGYSSFVVYDARDNKASVAIFSYVPSRGWSSGITVDDLTGANIEALRETYDGFELVALQSVSTTVKRYRYRYEGEGNYCDIEGYGLSVFLSESYLSVEVEICAPWTWKYDDAFVNRMFDSFTYRER